MKKKLLICLLVTVVLLVSLCSCGDKGKIVGTWDGTGISYTFNKDGTYSAKTLGLIATEGEWSINEDEKEITIKTGSIGLTYSYSFDEDGNLVLEDALGTKVSYTKK